MSKNSVKGKYNAVFYDKKFVKRRGDDVVNLEELFEFVYTRMRLLNIIDKPLDLKRFSPDWVQKIELILQEDPNFQKYLSFIQSKLIDDQFFQLDVAAHHLILKAHSDSRLYKDWILTQEADLFAWKCRYIQTKDLDLFMQENGIKCERVIGAQKYEILLKMQESDMKGMNKNLGEEIFKVQMNGLVYWGDADMLVWRGCTYFRKDSMWKFLRKIFIEKAAKNLEEMKYVKYHDIRLLDIIDMVKQMQKDRFANDGCLRIRDIEDLDQIVNKNYFPPCMTSIYKELKTKHFLGYHGRNQLGIFLKTTGVSCQTQLELWEKEFLKDMSEEDYKKKRYHYYIKYWYGLVGRGDTSYLQTCNDVTSITPEYRNFTGCPFARNDEDRLLRLCKARGLTQQQIKVILEPTESLDDCRSRCTNFFKYRNNISDNEIKPIESPLDFLKRSLDMDKRDSDHESDDEKFNVVLEPTESFDDCRSSCTNFFKYQNNIDVTDTEPIESHTLDMD